MLVSSLRIFRIFSVILACLLFTTPSIANSGSLSDQGHTPVMSLTGLQQVQSFSDVPPTHWAFDEIETLAKENVTNGCGDSHFCPDWLVTRDQMAVFIVRALGESPVTSPAGSFIDVPPTHWAAGYIERLAQLGITAGCGGDRFCPDWIVSRDQMAVFLIRALHEVPELSPTGQFDDVARSHWAVSHIERLAQLGITSGCGDDNFCPGWKVARDQMAVLLVRTFFPTRTSVASFSDPTYNTPFLTDAQLEDYASMSVSAIRQFLSDHGSYLSTTIQDVDGVTIDPTQLIYDAAHRYRINPKVILTTIQKEQGYITRGYRNRYGLSLLMGAGSQSTARAQIDFGTSLFRAYQDELNSQGYTRSGWRVGVAKTTQDGVSVTPAAKAVAGQFTYTPYAGRQWGGNTRFGGVYLFYYYWQQFFGNQGSVMVNRVWTSAPESDFTKSTFASNDPIWYRAEVDNSSTNRVSASFTWSATGPRQIVHWSGSLDIPAGGSIWYLPTDIPGDAPAGTYTFRVESRYNGQTSGQQTDFTVQQASSGLATLYEHTFYQGRFEDFSTDDPDFLNNYIGNDTVSSIKVRSGYAATLYEHTYYGGHVETFMSEDPHLLDNHIGNDTVSSIRIRRACGGALGINQTVSGSIDTAYQRCIHTFNGNSGQWISIRMIKNPAGTGSLDTYLELRDSAGDLIKQDDDGAWPGSYNSFLTTQLPSTGSYHIVARGFSSSTGNYRLRLESGREAAVGDLNRDCQVNDADVSILMSRWNTDNQDADLDLNSTVNSVDFDVMRENRDRTCGGSSTSQMDGVTENDLFITSYNVDLGLIVDSRCIALGGLDLDLTQLDLDDQLRSSFDVKWPTSSLIRALTEGGSTFDELVVVSDEWEDAQVIVNARLRVAEPPVLKLYDVILSIKGSSEEMVVPFEGVVPLRQGNVLFATQTGTVVDDTDVILSVTGYVKAKGKKDG